MDIQEKLPFGKRKRIWARYNLAKTKEKLFFFNLLDELCNALPAEPVCDNGRPPIPLRDLVFCACLKLYLGCSGRKAHQFFQDAQNAGWITKCPHFNTLNDFMKSPETVLLFEKLITVSAMPLKELEDTFAMDSTGFSSRFHISWFNNVVTAYEQKHPEKRVPKLRRDFIKAHLVVGVASKIVVSCVITDSFEPDVKSAPKLLEKVADHFNARTIVADKGYCSKRIFQVIDSLGAEPYILFKSNTDPNAKNSPDIWNKMFNRFTNNRELFMKTYNQRSNIENCNSTIKNKFGERLRYKNHVGQASELLTKLLVHNLCVLSYEMLGTDINADFGKRLLTYIDEEGRFAKDQEKKEKEKKDLGE